MGEGDTHTAQYIRRVTLLRQIARHLMVLIVQSRLHILEARRHF